MDNLESDLWRTFQNNYFVNNADILPCFSSILPHDAAGIKEHILRSSHRVFDVSSVGKYDLRGFIHRANSVLYPSNNKLFGGKWFMFIVILASYVVDRGGTYMDMVNMLAKGADIKCIPDLYVKNGKISIGMLCKLFGLGQFGNMDKMDCPRVWDLETDEIIDNPNFGNDPIHQIAAITHRWQNKEIVYKDLVDIEQTNKILKELDQPTKSVKISCMSSKLAEIRKELKDIIRYIWMDTICIDKTSSVELDMSIRSMYRWYSNAAFVYLDGTTKFDEWCTRGWTLQECIAAKVLYTSPKHGSFMQAISNMNNSIVHSLGLDESHDHYSSIYWIRLMELRQTTKIEDKAYALIGLLGIDFHIAYGEGERAINRVYEQLARQKGDVSWLACDNFRYRVDERLTMEELWHCMDSNLRHEIQITGAGMKLEVMKLGRRDLVRLNTKRLCDRITYGQSLQLMRYLTLDTNSTNDTSLANMELRSKMYCWIPSNNILVELYKVDGQKAWKVIRTRLIKLDWEDNTRENMVVIMCT